MAWLVIGMLIYLFLTGFSLSRARQELLTQSQESYFTLSLRYGSYVLLFALMYQASTLRLLPFPFYSRFLRVLGWGLMLTGVLTYLGLFNAIAEQLLKSPNNKLANKLLRWMDNPAIFGFFWFLVGYSFYEDSLLSLLLLVPFSLSYDAYLRLKP